MFTNVALHQQPHHFSQSLQYPNQNHYGDSPFNPPLPSASYHSTVRHGINQQRLQKPQQYAYPLSRSVSHSRSKQESSLTGCTPNLEVSEYMLRRKTPNGTLAAGYDGRPVEWTARPHAVKHVLMPMPHAIGETKYQPRLPDWPSDQPPSCIGKNLVSRDHGQRQALGHGMAKQNTCSEIPLPVVDRRHSVHPAIGLDSVLNQGSGFHQHGNMAGDQLLPTILQPMWPPCMGLTSLNAPAYGPYWPDGAIVPYRPAPLRDPRFPNFRDNPVLAASHLHSLYNNHAEWNSPLEQPNFHYDTSQQAPKYVGSVESSNNYLPAQVGDQNQIPHYPYNQDVRIFQQHQLPLVHRGKPHTFRGISESSDATWGDSSRLLTSDHSVLSQHAFQKPNIRAGHVQFKDKVLMWAHRVYESLLSSMNQSHRNIHHGDRQPQPAVFPKPPRQSFLNPSKSHGSVCQNQEKLHTQKGTAQGNLDTLLEHEKRWPTFSTPYSSFADERSVPSEPLRISPPSRQNSNFPQRWHPNDHKGLSPYLNPPIGPQTQTVSTVPSSIQYQHDISTSNAAATALEMLERLCEESGWEWTDGILLGGCIAYGLGDFTKAMSWYMKVMSCDPNNVEAMSNLAATLLSLNRRDEAEQHWIRSIKLRPSFFEATEHLVGLLCEGHRGNEAIKIIEYVEEALRVDSSRDACAPIDANAKFVGDDGLSPSISSSERLGYGISDREIIGNGKKPSGERAYSDLGFSGYDISPSDNGRMLGLIHGKGNMLYALGDNAGAAKAFEDAILIGAGRRLFGIRGLIKQILTAFSDRSHSGRNHPGRNYAAEEPVLLAPNRALETARLVFPCQGQLPGLKGVPNSMAKRAAVSIVSNSLLSLAKIYQDGMSSSGASANGPRATAGVQEILALYYLSLSLQPSPSTANNVGILLASVQQSVSAHASTGPSSPRSHQIPGIVPGSGIALALDYYDYGLSLDSNHAHLYTNLGSLFKDIGQLSFAIRMYERAVDCDGKFDIALANLANAVKDQGKISDAINYYRRAVSSNPDFAEAVCGLANALNSVCSWNGRGGVYYLGEKRDRWHVDEAGMLYDGKTTRMNSSGWIERVVAIVDKQLQDGESWGKGVLQSIHVEDLLRQFDAACSDRESKDLRRALESWVNKPWEGAKVVRLVERATKRLGWEWYRDKYVRRKPCSSIDRLRPQLPAVLAIPSAPTVLPFHTFTCPLSAKQIRKISQRNGLRISCSTLRAPWLPARIYEPPAPPSPQLHVGYVSSDFNNHPLAHLMQSVFGLHNKARVNAFCYATTAGDGSVHRQQIEREAPCFYDASSWSIDRLANQIVEDGVHILVNLNGYTRGARNEVFAARPAPIQMSFMGFAGTLGAEWCDYLLADEIAVPPQTLRPWRGNIDLLDQTMDENNEDDPDNWVYGENLIFTRDTFFCCDHRQSAPDAQEVRVSWADEQVRRWRMRRELFPDLTDDTIILGNFNQLYKIEPTTFRTWLRILSRVPNAVLWLLRFPELGEQNLRDTALLWGGEEVASRIVFTDVAPKHQHISRARVCDLFLDTPECNAHTTAADVLWSGTPLLTLPRYEYKMCSRMAASILRGALPKTAQGDCAMEELVVHSDEDYEERAVELGSGLIYPIQGGMQGGRGHGRLMELRKLLYESRWESALFDTRRWVRDLEIAYWEAWRRWVAGEGGDIWLK